MNQNPYRAFLNKNPEYHQKRRNRLNMFYGSVLRLLYSWTQKIPRDPVNFAIYRMLYEGNDVATIDRESRLSANMRTLDAALNCGKRGHYCGFTTYCPECLSFWRYKIAKGIQLARQVNPKIKLICRQETILMPRGIYQDQYDNNQWKFLINRRINPIEELPVGSKRSSYWLWKFIEEDRRLEFRTDPETSSERYWDCFNTIWNTIAGSDIVENPAVMDMYSRWSPEDQQAYCNRRRDNINRIDNDIKKGFSDSIKHPLLAELRSRMFRLNNIFKFSMGSAQRIIMAPSILNMSTILLRIDSLFLDTWESYRYLEERYGELGQQKRFESIDWPGQRDGLQVWHPRSKVVTFCKSIPNDINEILSFVESRFPCSCYVYPRLLTAEFPFYLNSFAERHCTRITGFFRNEGEL